ncbi:Sugar transporter SemiSWEET [Tepidimonas sediminis]|uniref:Sugar transporter SemiSWEET n=1 Tax=Tepidimonas sediminis TaxID=2588941 RepID=A0A554WQK0_9BURK|nr:SemiSWEET transporter [Tepidimonas sediminis]TSE25844.1 Sugar transporter SemiSWEET [Tepidimonas sediminis]
MTLSLWTDVIGTLAATLTTISFVPQAWLTWRTRDVAGISPGMYALFALGVALWLVYGILLRAWPIIVANAITLTLALLILTMRLRYGPRRSAAHDRPSPSGRTGR